MNIKHFIAIPALLMLVWLAIPGDISAQKDPKFDYPSLQMQLTAKYHGESVAPDSELARLIAENQEFSMLRPDEFNDERGLPPWLRVWYRKGHPEVEYSAEDPTKGYPLVLKEILEWMVTHQDLKPGPGSDSAREGKPSFVDMLVGTNIRTSGAQSVPRSESYIQINFFNPQQILIGSNNIGGSGQQGIYRSADGGTTWAQTTLPLTGTDSFHSDPTVDYTSDGRAWSSTLGIVGSTLRVRNYVSTDNGATWAFEGTPSGSQTNVDKQIVWIDKSATSPYFGQTYAIWHNGNPAFVNRRTAGAGGTWLANPIQVSGAETTGTAIGADIRSNSIGEVFGFWPTTTNRRIIMIKSTDGGNTWTPGAQIATTFDGFDIGIPSFNSRRAFIYVSGGGYRTVSKNMVYASWTDLSGETGCTAAANEPGSNVSSTCKMRVWFSRSTDGGTTWSAPVKINNQAGLNDQFSQWLAIDETNGNLVIIYNDTVADPGRKKSDIWYQASYDDGATWTTAEKVTTAMTDETIAGADSGNQYGDYNGLSGFANSFFPSWTDRRNNAKEEIWTALISLGPPPPPAPIINSAGVAITAENGVPANGVPDPGESLTVSLGLRNVGNADTGNAVTATLQPTGGVTNPNSGQNYGTLTFGGAAVSRNFTFRVDPAAVCGSSITLTWVVQDGMASQNVTQTYSLGTPAVSLSQNFDGVTAPALPAGWATTNEGAGPPALWTTSATGPNSAPNSAFTNDPATIGSSYLESPVTAINSPSAQVKFKNKYTTESTFDGMVLEIKIGAGAYTDIITAGGSWVSGGYNATISTGFSSPIAGRAAWSGTSAGYIDSVANLPAAANGQNVQLRWRMATDSSVAATGVNVDDVQIINGFTCAAITSAKKPFDFDGDQKTDLSVYRPNGVSGGEWWYNRSSNSTVGAATFGNSTDKPMAVDFTGDGKTDISFFRPSTGTWYVLRSEDLTFYAFPFGNSTDTPAPADYDGDGKADAAVFRASAATWYINKSTGGTTITGFGIPTDLPVPADYDGDGKADIGVFRPTGVNGAEWWIQRSTAGLFATQFGSSGYKAVPGDYTGDGKADVAFWIPASGQWFILRSENLTYYAFPFGSSTDVPVPGDYDGDGKLDAGVFRPSNATWYINKSTGGTTIQQFGNTTDTPIPNVFVR